MMLNMTNATTTFMRMMDDICSHTLTILWYSTPRPYYIRDSLTGRE